MMSQYCQILFLQGSRYLHCELDIELYLWFMLHWFNSHFILLILENVKSEDTKFTALLLVCVWEASTQCCSPMWLELIRNQCWCLDLEVCDGFSMCSINLSFDMWIFTQSLKMFLTGEVVEIGVRLWWRVQLQDRERLEFCFNKVCQLTTNLCWISNYSHLEFMSVAALQQQFHSHSLQQSKLHAHIPHLNRLLCSCSFFNTFSHLYMC